MSYGAKVVLDSICGGVRLTTFEICIPKFEMAALNTHRQFSRNAASSRAIPVKKMLEMVKTDPVLPVWWGKTQAGMQAREELDSWRKDRAEYTWLQTRDYAVKQAEYLLELGLHKQIANRLLEPWMFTTVLVSATEYDNFFKLRCHPDAQPELKCVAEMMRDLYESGKPEERIYHRPFITPEEDLNMPWSELNSASAARCARISYLTHDGVRDWAKDLELAVRLRNDSHLSPFEHQATYDGTGSGNFRGWRQNRADL